MSDSSIATGAPVASPAPSASPAPASEPTPSAAPERTSTEDLAIIGKASETAIGEQMDDDENTSLSEPERKFNRAKRYKAGRDVARQGEAAARQEAAELRRQLAERTGAANDGDAGDGEQVAPEGYEDAQAPEAPHYASPEDQAAALQQIRERVARDLETVAVLRYNEQKYAQANPTYHDDIAAVLPELLRRPDYVREEFKSPEWGHKILHEIAKDPQRGLPWLDAMEAGGPREAARIMARMEAAMEAHERQQQQRAPAPQRRIPQTTRAAPPMSRLVGSGTGPQSQLAQVDAFIKKTYGERG